MSLQTPLRRVLGLGSAKEGSGHWWAQRLTAVALVPLGLWFVFAALGLEHGQHEIVRAWIAEPANSILLILLVITLLYHSYLGLQVVIEDYVHGALKIATLVIVQFLHVLLAVGGIYAVISTTAGGGS
ncbi:MAG: succinate dehydrogenase, hydrophobic membrane anchor protein [Gammaproteobacteria bacterium]|nr:succinate dehydrogenase, hydrophobic membrane anchor protein [Gammaproteobacteria bacterium]